MMMMLMMMMAKLTGKEPFDYVKTTIGRRGRPRLLGLQTTPRVVVQRVQVIRQKND